MNNKTLNVIQIIDALSVGGAEMMSVQIANLLSEKNHIISHVCSTRIEGDLKFKLNENVEYIFLNKKRTIDIKAILKLKNYLKTHNIGIIHAHSNSFFIGALIKIFFLPNITLIWHNHTGSNTDLKGFKKWTLKYFSFFFKAIIHVNEELKKWGEKELHTKFQFYLQNFANFTDEKKTYLKGEEKKRIICIAAYRIEKNHLNLLQAFKFINEKYPDWTLHLVGKGYEDRYQQLMNSFILQNKLDNHVFQYGVQSDIGHILSQSTIAVLSSDSEGLPVSLLEYGLAGLPVVVTDVGQCSHVLQNGKFGVIVPKKNSLNLGQSILSLIENENLRIQFANQYKQHIFEHYSKESFFKKLIKIYTIG